MTHNRMGGLEIKAMEVAVREGIAGTVDGLDIRYSIIPDMDLLDENKHNLTKREWVQPVNGVYGTAEVDELIYGGIRDQYQKVLVLTGVRTLQSRVWATSIVIGSATSVINIEGVQGLTTSVGEAFGRKDFEMPYIFGPKAGMKILLRPATDGVGQQDKLYLEGFIVEPKGVNVS